MSSPALLQGGQSARWATAFEIEPSYQMLVTDMTQPGSGGTIPALEIHLLPSDRPANAAFNRHYNSGLPPIMHSASKGRTT
jgi:hypothetical protein